MSDFPRTSTPVRTHSVLRALFSPAIIALVIAAPSTAQSMASDNGVATKSARADELPMVVERGQDRQRLIVPRDEELGFVVTIELGALGRAKAGDLTLASRVEPFRAGGVVQLDAHDEGGREQAIITAHATGSYAVYTVDQTISTRVLPQAWPQLVHRNEQLGTENRRRELLIGERDGKWIAQHRSDGHCKGCEDRAHFMKPNWLWQSEYHCKKCRRLEHRVWREPERRDVPEGTVDMVTAMMLARSMVLDRKPSMTFTLVDKETLWEVDVSLGKHERREVPAGKFDAVEVKLVTRPPKSEPGRAGDFEGLFGLHGNIAIWMHEETGVPIEVRGTVPVGPLQLNAAVELTSFRGTASAFRAASKK